MMICIIPVFTRGCILRELGEYFEENWQNLFNGIRATWIEKNTELNSLLNLIYSFWRKFMKDGGRLSAATEVLTEIIDRHRPAKDALKDWGIQHRFAGSTDRTIIGNLVFDVLRCKSSLSWRVNSDNPRLLVLCAYSILWNNGVEKLQTILESDKYAPEGLSDTERKEHRKQ